MAKQQQQQMGEMRNASMYGYSTYNNKMPTRLKLRRCMRVCGEVDTERERWSGGISASCFSREFRIGCGKCIVCCWSHLGWVGVGLAVLGPTTTILNILRAPHLLNRIRDLWITVNIDTDTHKLYALTHIPAKWPAANRKWFRSTDGTQCSSSALRAQNKMSNRVY